MSAKRTFVQNSPRTHRPLFERSEVALAMQILKGVAGYAPTPLRSLPTMAEEIGMANLLYKDEGGRFGRGSFKALGTVVAIEQATRGAAVEQLVVAAATAGNYGRALAWAAKRKGVRCVIYVHSAVARDRIDRIAAEGAEVRRVEGDYDDAVAEAAREALRQGWRIVSDTTNAQEDEITRWVMIGYAALIVETAAQAGCDIDYIVVPGGVGGLAAAVVTASELFLEERPQIFVFEPATADCLLESANSGVLSPSHGSLETMLTPLACRTPSAMAWPVLQAGAAGFFAISDEDAIGGAAALGALRVEAGPCAGASIGALTVLRRHVLLEARNVLVIGTDGSV